VEDEVAVVVPCSSLLHLLLNVVETILKQLRKLSLGDVDQLAHDQLGLHIPFQHGPQGLDRVEFRAVRRHEHEIQAEVACQLPHFLSMVRRVVVKYDVYFFVGRELVLQQWQEAQHVFLVSCVSLHEQRAVHLGADGAEHCDALPASLVQRPPDGEVGRSPSPVSAHPHVERGLIEVNYGLVVQDHSRQGQRKVQDRTSRLPECLLVCEADRSHLDVVLQVKCPECTWCDLDIHVDL
jgi:hypothetical protein